MSLQPTDDFQDQVILRQVIEFVHSLGFGYKMGFPIFHKKRILTKETTLQELGIYGDDAGELIMAFGEKFNVNTHNFNIDKYFKSEGDPIGRAIVRFIRGKKNSKRMSLTIGELEAAVISGELR